MNRTLLVVALVALAAGAVITTGAFTTGGDEAVRGVYLEPADTPNGERYAEISSTGQFQIQMTNLNPEATTVAEDVFLIGTDLEQADVWIEDNRSAVSFYRMDTGGSVEDESDPVELTDGESVLIGMRIATGTDEVVLETVTIRALVPEESGGSSGGSVSVPGGSVVTETPTDEPETPTDTLTDDTVTATDTPTATDRSTNGTETPAGSPTETDTQTEPAGETETATATETESGGGANPTGTPPADIEIVELTTDPAEPGIGQTVTVTGTFQNVGSSERTVTLELRAGGEIIASETVTLAPGERRTISGTVTFDEPGAYEVALGDQSVTVTVEEASQSPLEIGGFAPLLLGGLVLLAAAALLLAYWRRDAELVVRLDDASQSRLELVTDGSSAATDTDADGRTILRFGLSGSGVTTFEPAFGIRNSEASAVGVRVAVLDDDGTPIESGVTIQSTDGVDITAFPEDDDAGTLLDGGETLTVSVSIEQDDAATAGIATLQVEAITDES